MAGFELQRYQLYFGILISLILYLLYQASVKTRYSQLGAPVVGRKYRWEPLWITRFRFSVGARRILAEGLAAHRTTPFQILRNDIDMLILPPNYAVELRNLPEHVASSSDALFAGLGYPDALTAALGSDLHFRLVQKHVTPSLSKLIPLLYERYQVILDKEIQLEGSDWNPVDLYRSFKRMAARTAGFMFLGTEASNDEAWIKASVEFTMDLFGSALALRFLPKFTHRIVYNLLPMTWNARRNAQVVKRIVSDQVAKLKANEKAGSGDVDEEFGKQFLRAALVDLKAAGRSEDTMHTFHLVLGVAAIHTTASLAIQAVYELCAHPEYIPMLREEIEEVVKSEGGWTKQTIDRLEKMDSVLKEVQRLNVAAMLSFNRIMKEPVTLLDGQVLPAGSQVAIATDAICRDPTIYPIADEFDGLRFYRARQEISAADAEEKAMKHAKQLFTTTSIENPSFGYGRYSCPGRFFASASVKLVLAQLILKYDFKYEVDGKPGRPGIMMIDEFNGPPLNAKVMMSRR